MNAPIWVASFHGVILGSGHSPKAAAAAAAAVRVSRVDVHLASDTEAAIARTTRWRLLPGTERELLKAIRVDLARTREAILWAEARGDEHIDVEPRFTEYALHRFHGTIDQVEEQLEAVERRIDAGLAELPARAAQRDLFAPAEGPA